MTDEQLIDKMARATAAKDPRTHAWEALPEIIKEMHRDYNRAALAVVRESEGWQPIEMAPRDGSKLLLWQVGSCCVGFFDHSLRYGGLPSWYTYAFDYNCVEAIDPTDWRPLPPPPKTEEGG